ncbi:MAG: hypothetical protein HN600_07690 [Bacteroidetes bacterium]|jgi:DNA primase|nr:hypothetical protein [Bacteroidota bacterium]
MSDITYFQERIGSLNLKEKDYTVTLRNSSNQPFEHKVFEADRKGNITMTPFTLKGELIYYDHPKATPEKPNGYNNKEQVYQVTRLSKAIVSNNGDSLRYMIPKGQGTLPFLTPSLLEKHSKQEKIKTLFLTEGVFKQYSASKYGLDIIGLTSITHYKDRKTGKLHSDILELIKVCQVQNVVMIYDGDCLDISKHALSQNKDVTQRLQQFINSAIAMRELLKDLEIQFYFCHIKSRELDGHPKGLDDLLILKKGKEKEILNNLQKFSEPSKYFYKLDITKGYKPLINYFGINNLERFYEDHIEVLKDYEFNFKGKFYQWDEETNQLQKRIYIDKTPIVFHQGLQFWYYDKNDEVKFDYSSMYEFLKANGFGKYITLDKMFTYIRIKGKIVEEVQPYQIRDFITDFLKEYGNRTILNMMFRGGKQYVSKTSLENLEVLNPYFPKSNKYSQLLFFENCVWEISANGVKEIKYQDFQGFVWADHIISFKPTLLSAPFNIMSLTESTGYDIQINKEYDSDFLSYIQNTSNVYWTKEEKGKTREEKLEEYQHFLSKINAFGYLSHSFNNSSKTWAVLGMDNTVSELGESNGGTGKSIFGFALGELFKYAYISGKKRNLTEDNHIWQGVDERTRIILIDDVRQSFDFEFLYPVLTGQLVVNPKNKSAFTIPKDLTPKLYISTNHALKVNGNSDLRRQWKIGFSDYYNSNRNPAQEFGRIFFDQDEWPDEQWNKFYNVAAYSIQSYLKLGKIEAPQQSIRLRELIAIMGNDFLDWAETYFYDSSRKDTSLERSSLYEDFKLNNPTIIKFYSSRKFKACIKAYCEYKEYTFNPEKNGEDDKRNSIEYFTLGTKL